SIRSARPRGRRTTDDDDVGRAQLQRRSVDGAGMTLDSERCSPNPGEETPSETVEIAMSPRPTSFLLEIQDDDDVRRVPVADTPLIIGTGRAADVVIRDRTVSSQHCVVVARDGGVSVKDLG